MNNDRLICLIRHGETQWNSEKRIQGREDIPLNEAGYQQAEVCGKALKAAGWKGRTIIASPLYRAYSTAKCIGNILDIREVLCEPDLTERDYGSASGSIKTMPGRQIEFSNEIYHGVEPWENLSERIYQCIVKTAAQVIDDTIIVSHGAAISALLAYISKGEIAPDQHVLKNTSISILNYQNKKLKLIKGDFQAEYLQDVKI